MYMYVTVHVLYIDANFRHFLYMYIAQSSPCLSLFLLLLSLSLSHVPLYSCPYKLLPAYTHKHITSFSTIKCKCIYMYMYIYACIKYMHQYYGPLVQTPPSLLSLLTFLSSIIRYMHRMTEIHT